MNLTVRVQWDAPHAVYLYVVWTDDLPRGGPARPRDDSHEGAGAQVDAQAVFFGALLSAIMVAIVSAFVLALNQGLHAGFVSQWLSSCAMTFGQHIVTVPIS